MSLVIHTRGACFQVCHNWLMIMENSSQLGTPPSLYTPVVGDAFALRSDYALQIDFEEKAPQFQVSDTHWAKTWLLHEDAPKVDKPAVIQNLHEKILANMGFAHLGDEEEGNA